MQLYPNLQYISDFTPKHESELFFCLDHSIHHCMFPKCNISMFASVKTQYDKDDNDSFDLLWELALPREAMHDVEPPQPQKPKWPQYTKKPQVEYHMQHMGNWYIQLIVIRGDRGFQKKLKIK